MHTNVGKNRDKKEKKKQNKKKRERREEAMESRRPVCLGAGTHLLTF